MILRRFLNTNQIPWLACAIFLFLIYPVANGNGDDNNNEVSSDKKENFEEEEYGVKYASPCEACKITALELLSKLEETSKDTDYLQTSYHLDARPIQKKEYKRSQVRLIESMEGACEGVLSYNVHKERKDSTRFAKGQSQTFRTLHGLVNKGVKVDLGMPYEMWDKPATEITDLKNKCESLIEKYEAEIEDWYNEGEKVPLMDYLCKDIALRGKDDQCLAEIPPPPEVEEEEKKEDGNNQNENESSRNKGDEL